MVISGGGSKASDMLKPKEVVSLLLDDEDIEQKCKYISALSRISLAERVTMKSLTQFLRSSETVGTTSGRRSEVNRE